MPACTANDLYNVLIVHALVYIISSSQLGRRTARNATSVSICLVLEYRPNQSISMADRCVCWCSLAPDGPFVEPYLSAVSNTASIASAKVEVVPELRFTHELD